MTDTPVLHYQVPLLDVGSRSVMFTIEGSPHAYVIVTADDEDYPVALADEGGSEDVHLRGQRGTGDLLKRARRGSREAQESLRQIALRGLIEHRRLADARAPMKPSISAVRRQRDALHSAINVELAKVGLRMPS